MENSKMKINVGCGWECREGWLNVDNTSKPQAANYPIIKMDATIAWPYNDETFDYVLSEHMIEHIPEEKGLFMLTEALRTLKLNGAIRITCPDRTFAENLPGKDTHPFVQAYARKIFQREPKIGDAAIISKRTLHEQGHLWVPTPEQLISQLIKAGFSNVKQVQYGKSEHKEFDGIELDDGVRNWESVCVEGIKL